VLDAAPDPAAAGLMSRCLALRKTVLDDAGLAVFLGGDAAASRVACVEIDAAARQGLDPQLLEVFCVNLAVECDNWHLLEKLRAAAYTDALTGLGNRAAMIDQLDRCRADGRCSDRSMLALVDIDQFSSVNDLFGHAYGDQLLCLVAMRLSQGLPSGCFIARVSNDTFAIWGEEEQLPLEGLRQHFDQPFCFEDNEHSVTVSIGAVRLRESGCTNGADLLKEAWIALKRAKLGGQGQEAYFSMASAEETREHTRLLHALRQAFRRDRLFLVYQPQIALDSGAVTGVEALLRWRGDDGRFIAPDRFLPVAESSGLIVDVGGWVLRSALRAAENLVQAGHGGIRMAVNVSAHQFAHPGFMAVLDAALAGSTMAPNQLELEITESVAVMGIHAVEQLLHAIKQRGVQVAIDDFGTGYSSLSYLDRFPADRLKIDRSFISVLLTETRGGRIAEMVVPLGRQLGLQVLAEGVETEEQANYLRQLGCHEAQGYLYAHPMPMPDLLQWLASRNMQASS